MATRNKWKKAALLASAFILLLAAGAAAEIVDKILVVVNDEVITQREVDRKLAPVYGQLRTTVSGDELNERMRDFRKQIVMQLVKDKLVVSEAKRKGVTVSEQEVDAELAEVRKQFRDDKEFYLALDAQGIGVEELRSNYRSSIMAKKLIDDRIGGKISVSPGEMIAYYNAHRDEFIDPPTARVRSILIRITSSRNAEESLAFAKDILARLENEPFAGLAEKYSDDQYAEKGGDMGYVKQGEMIERINTAIFTLKQGEHSDIIRTDLGYHIFLVEDTMDGRVIPFDRVSDDIERRIFKQKVNMYLEEYIDNLRENAYIAFK
ncbi:MAG: peptidylprolyl isomerase [Candidatus Omnitrophota bacterium]